MSDILRTFQMAALTGLILTTVAVADDATADKSRYTLFNPTPVDQMRPLSADRPDGTESPYTVDAGHFQLEISLFDFVHDNDDGDRTDTYTVLDTNLKIGLTNWADLQILMPVMEHEKSDPQGTTASSVTDSGDVTVRLKINLWGNDGGETAFGVMPFIKIPTHTSLSNGRVEGGLLLSYAWNVAETWGLGFMLELDSVFDDDTGDDEIETVHTAVLGIDLTDQLGAYFEYIGTTTSASGHAYQAVFSTGLTYALTENLVWDVGAMIGINEAAEDVRAFIGFTLRY